MANPLPDIQAGFSWYLAYIAPHPAKARLACLKPFTLTIHNGIYSLWKSGLYFLSSVQMLSGMAMDCITDFSLCFSDSQEQAHLPLKWLSLFQTMFPLPKTCPSSFPWKLKEFFNPSATVFATMECQESDYDFNWLLLKQKYTGLIFLLINFWLRECAIRKFWIYLNLYLHTFSWLTHTALSKCLLTDIT